MTTFERRKRLLDLLRHSPGLRVGELAAALAVSEGTVRNDLNALEEEGQLRRVRGGAVVEEQRAPQISPSFSARLKRQAEAKQNIARWAAELVEDGDSILLDASSTVYHIARYLQNRQRLRVITNGLEAARLLAQNPTNTVILLGGVLNPDGSSITGAFSERMLDDLYIQTAFVSCSGIAPEIGLTEVHISEAQLKSKAIRSAGRVVALVDSSKFGKVDLTPFARLEQISHLYTDCSLAPEWVETLRNFSNASGDTCLGVTICDRDNASTFSPCSLEARHYRIGFANQDERLPFSVDVRRGLERAAKAAGNIDLTLADNRLDPDTALQVAQRFLTQKLDLVIEYQLDEMIGNRLMSLFQEAGLPVISVDIPMVGATFFGIDNYRAGRMAGEALGEWARLNWAGRYDHVLILEEPRAGALPAARLQGQLDGLQAILGAIPAERQTRLNSGNTGEVSCEQTLLALRRLRSERHLLVVCFNDDAALGALQAARQAGRLNDVAIVGQGADRPMRRELRRPGSRIIGSTAFSPEKYGASLVALALRLLRGEPVPPAEYIQPVLITPQNIDLHYPEAEEPPDDSRSAESL